MANRVVEQFDQKITAIERRLQAMRAMRDAIAHDPEFVTVVQEILLDPASNGLPDPVRETTVRQPDAPNYERMVAFMLSQGNPWMSIRDIGRGTMLKRNSISQVLYNSGRKVFFDDKHISKGRRVWRVKPDVAKELASENCITIPDLPVAEEPEEVVPAKVAKSKVTKPRLKVAVVEEPEPEPQPSLLSSQPPSPLPEPPVIILAPPKGVQPKSKYGPSSRVQQEEVAS